MWFGWTKLTMLREEEEEVMAAVASMTSEHPSITIGNLRNKRAQIKMRM